MNTQHVHLLHHVFLNNNNSTNKKKEICRIDSNHRNKNIMRHQQHEERVKEIEKCGYRVQLRYGDLWVVSIS